VDNAAASRIAHGDLALMNPLSAAALDEAIGLLELPAAARVLDVACGRGEVLRRIAARWDVRAAGYDSDPAAIAEARWRVPVAELRVADTPPDGPFELAACVASSHALGGFPNALRALRDLVEPGGQVVFGEGYWRREPTPAYLEALGGASADELAGYAGLLEAAQRAGLTPMFASVASEADWDRYEWTLILNAERWADAHAGDPGVPVLRERAARARARLALPGGRETLGFALLMLRAEPNG
jgi:SAM-dependent methyltransferase